MLAISRNTRRRGEVVHYSRLVILKWPNGSTSRYTREQFDRLYKIL